MILELLPEFKEGQGAVVLDLISKKAGRKLEYGSDHVFIDYNDKYDYAAIIYNDDVMGFLDVDYSEPCIVFTPSYKLLP